MNIPHSPFSKRSRRSPRQQIGLTGVLERLLLQHAFSLFIASLVLLFFGFLIFFYLFFYTSVSGQQENTDSIHSVQKTVNLVMYGQVVDTHHTKLETGATFGNGKETIPNPFIVH